MIDDLSAVLLIIAVESTAAGLSKPEITPILFDSLDRIIFI